MKKCLILLAALIVALIISIVKENDVVEMPESVMAINNTEGEYSTLRE